MDLLRCFLLDFFLGELIPLMYALLYLCVKLVSIYLFSIIILQMFEIDYINILKKEIDIGGLGE